VRSFRTFLVLGLGVDELSLLQHPFTHAFIVASAGRDETRSGLREFLIAVPRRLPHRQDELSSRGPYSRLNRRGVPEGIIWTESTSTRNVAAGVGTYANIKPLV
jgi:hypothetical protein